MILSMKQTHRHRQQISAFQGGGPGGEVWITYLGLADANYYRKDG